MGNNYSYDQTATIAEFIGRITTNTLNPFALSEDEFIISYLISAYIEDKHQMVYDAEARRWSNNKSFLKLVTELVEQIPNAMDLYKHVFLSAERVDNIRFNALRGWFERSCPVYEAVVKEEKGEANFADTLLNNPDGLQKAEAQNRFYETLRLKFKKDAVVAIPDDLTGADIVDFDYTVETMLVLVHDCAKLNEDSEALETALPVDINPLKRRNNDVKLYLRKQDLACINYTLSNWGDNKKRRRAHNETAKLIRKLV